MKSAGERDFYIGDHLVEKVGAFKCLGRVLDENNIDWPTMQKNLWGARIVWNRVKKVLINENTTSKVMGYFYKAIVQAVLLYGSESWVLTKVCLARLSSFHNKVACSLTGIYGHPDPGNPEVCIYPNMEEVLDQAGLCHIEEYIVRQCQPIHQNYVLDHSGWYQACIQQTTPLGSHMKKTWWNLV